ncbi:MAG: LuxR family transcriptional regulator [Alphaproteobacteria bacterium]|nr:LuxR family transcriptional regulator [Alphaproteobacteria bacterium]
MNYLGKIDNYIRDVDAAQNIEEVCVAVRTHIEPQGFERFTYALLISPHGPVNKPLYISTYPSEWANRYVQQKYASRDLIMRFVATTLRPFLWDEVSEHAEITKVQHQIFNEASDFNILSGGSVPIHGPGAVKASFAVASSLPEPEFARLFLAQRHELHLVATYAHERMLDIGLIKDPRLSFKLTPREVDVLTWTACGKTAWEISEILSLSEDTVREYIKNACRALNTNNKTHAIAVALVNGLIII